MRERALRIATTRHKAKACGRARHRLLGYGVPPLGGTGPQLREIARAPRSGRVKLKAGLRTWANSDAACRWRENSVSSFRGGGAGDFGFCFLWLSDAHDAAKGDVVRDRFVV